MMGAKEMISKSFSLLKRDIKIWAAFALCEVGVTFLGIALRMSGDILTFFVNKGFSIFVVSTLFLFLFTILFLLGFWINITLIRVVAKRIHSVQNGTLIQELHESRHLIARTLGATILFHIFVFLPIFLGIVGFSVSLFSGLIFGKSLGNLGSIILATTAIYGVFHAFFFSIEYGFTPLSIILDGQHIRQGFHMSNRLVSGRFLATLWRVVAPLTFYIIFFSVIGFILKKVAQFIPESSFLWAVWFLTLIISSFSPILFIASMNLLYDELKKTVAPGPVPPEGK